MQKAIAYCRVSSERQVKEGNGLDSQEQRLRNYCMNQQYHLVKVFREEGISGALIFRPALEEMYAYLDKNKDEKYVIVFDDLKRLARDVSVYFQIKSQIISRGHTVESPNFKFEDSAEGTFFETIIAAHGALERDQNRRQVKQKQKTRLEAGFWAFGHPPGLENRKHPVYKKILVPVEPYPQIFLELFQKYRDGRLASISEASIFLAEQYTKYGIAKKKKLSDDTTARILMNPLYAGYLHYPRWNVSLRKAQHEGFIPYELFQEVQEIITGKKYSPVRKDYSGDFPLRGFILCTHCQNPMTASWSKGRKKSYPHYFCRNRECPIYTQETFKGIKTNIHTDKVHTQFESFIQSLEPNIEMSSFIEEIIQDIWAERVALEAKSIGTKQKDLMRLESQKKTLVERVSTSTDPTLVAEYESSLKEIIEQIKKLNEEIPVRQFTDTSFRTASEIIMMFMKKPILLWQDENPQNKRLLMEMYFAEKLQYDVKNGFRTASLALLPKLLSLKGEDKSVLVEMSGIEPESNKVCL